MTAIDKNIINIIMNSRKPLSLSNNEIRVEKGNSNFDITIGSFDGAEVCELVGLYIPNILKKEFCGKNIGLYRDDGLSRFEYKSGLELKKKKSYVKFLKITV